MVIDAAALVAVLTGQVNTTECLPFFDTPPHTTTFTLLEVMDRLHHLEPRAILDAIKPLDLTTVDVDVALILDAKRKPFGPRDTSLAAALARRGKTNLITLEAGKVVALTA
jgi:hypothetical protein